MYQFNKLNFAIESDISDKSSKSWITDAIERGYIQVYPFNEFKNIRSNGEGRFGRVAIGEWSCADRNVALKQLKDYDIQRFAKEVNKILSLF